ncbi:MAG: hypothetical protein G5663_07085 [Serratia symbiotica]|nr:hypothetical protein [Serratia symbiotica]
MAMIYALNKMTLAGIAGKCTRCLKDAHSGASLFQIQFIQQIRDKIKNSKMIAPVSKLTC